MRDKLVYDLYETDIFETEAPERPTNLRKIIAFDFADELYGVDIQYVGAILLVSPIMPIPNVSNFVLGLINLRGSLLPLIDLRIKFGLKALALTPESRVVVLENSDLKVGMIVDRVWELLRLPPESFQPAPPGVAKIDPQYFQEVCSIDGRMLIVLNVEKLLVETAAGAESG